MSDSLGQLPGSLGWPLLGNTLSFLHAPTMYVQRAHEKYGPIYRDSVFFERLVTVLDADAAAEVLADRDRVFSSRLGWNKVFGRLFANGLLLRDHDDHKFHRGIIQVAFLKKVVRRYNDTLNSLVNRSLTGWDADSRIALHSRVKADTLNAAAVVFLGLELGPDAERVNRAFQAMLDGLAAVVRLDLPGTAFGRGMRARRSLEAFFLELIAERRNSSSGQDLLTRLCHAQSESGARLRDKEIVDHTVFVLMAAHDTTTSALSSLILELALQPRLQQRMRDECLALGTEFMRYDDLAQLPLTHNAFKETLRLFPPVRSIPRRTLRACELVGFEIPADTNVWVLPSFIHLNPAHWTNPTVFDPDRYSDARAEHKNHRYAWIPFGSGAHTCLGLHVAEVQIKTFIYQMLRKYRWELPGGYRPRRSFVPMPKVLGRLPLRVSRL